MDKQGKEAEDIFVQRCRSSGLRLTPQRLAVYESLSGDKSHPSAEKVFRKVRKMIPNISFDTVNRTLLSFVSCGILKAVESYGRVKRFDPGLGEHHHFQCLKCGKIIDFEYPDFASFRVPETIRRKFVVMGKRIVLTGICDSCR